MTRKEAFEWIVADESPESGVEGVRVKYLDMSRMHRAELGDHFPTSANCTACIAANLQYVRMHPSTAPSSKCVVCALPKTVCADNGLAPCLWRRVTEATHDQEAFRNACLEIVVECEAWLDDHGVTFEDCD